MSTTNLNNPPPLSLQQPSESVLSLSSTLEYQTPDNRTKAKESNDIVNSGCSIGRTQLQPVEALHSNKEKEIEDGIFARDMTPSDENDSNENSKGRLSHLNSMNNLNKLTTNISKLEALQNIKSIPPPTDDDPMYDRFSEFQKSTFVAIISFTCFLSPISHLAFIPSIPELATDLNTTATVITASQAIYAIGMATSPFLLGPLASLYGRRIMMICCALGFTTFTALSGASRNIPMFFIFRTLTAMASTSCFNIGGAIIGDIKRPKQRGRAMGWVLLGTQVGPCFGPILGGLIVSYTSWRVIFWVMTGLGFIDLLLVVFVLKETSRIVVAHEIKKQTGKRFVFVSYNVFRVLLAFRYPNLILAGFASSSMTYNMYGLLTPIRQVINPRFDLISPIDGAVFYFAPGVGYILGSFVGGRYADYTVKKWMKKRNGAFVPEDRLKSGLIAQGFIQPVCMLIYGWCLRYKKGGKAVPIIAMFFCAFGQNIVFPSINAYCIDCSPELKGDASASNYFARFMIGSSIASGTCLVQIHHIGVGWFSTISALVLWFGFLCYLLVVIFGAKLREEAKKDFLKRKQPNDTKV
ncbi:unnamed protein product [Ambrosiozyma monospora]|uniref:Unnamed protein product n=1 Tax=Ambrosiozyma monospora TaxID=43982 RepID=A0ACB5TD52_AMBMO|nr:unnamed protein product [Ambrosiozyma monospora]